ncbi:MAG: hypothetical protein N2508_13000 [Anaerolineae bacterium]|nr:hypothetical protein [Anaerolineae bacterium]
MPSKKARSNRRRYRKFESVSTLVLGWSSAKAGAAPRTLRLVPLLLVGVITILALWVGLDERFYIRRADVQGAVRTLPAEIFRASGLRGLHLLWVHPARAEQRILSELPTLESARVRCGLRLPAECTIVVRERQPKVAWNEGNLVWWIDAEGMIFTPAPVGGEEVMWTISGPLPRGEDGRLAESVRVALNELWARSLPEAGRGEPHPQPLPGAERGVELPTSFEYVPGRGLTFVNSRGWRIILGEGTGMERRLTVLAPLTAYLEERGLSPRFVDVRFPDTPYYSLVNDW